MSSMAPQGFRRTAGMERSLPRRSSRDPGLTNCSPNRGNSVSCLAVFARTNRTSR